MIELEVGTGPVNVSLYHYLHLHKMRLKNWLLIYYNGEQFDVAQILSPAQ